jgi:hypothetical protein
VLILAAVVVGSFRTNAAAPLLLCHNGVARSVILLPARPSSLERYAAAELAAYLEKMTGGLFPLLKEGAAIPPAKAVINIGRTRMSVQLAMQGTLKTRTSREVFRVAS